MFGEIYLCRFPFTSGVLSKPRPALVDLRLDVLVYRITPAPPAGPLDITIADWAQAGLAKPSIARLDRLVTAEKTLLWRGLGKLTPADAAVVRHAWNQHMRL